MASCWGRGTNDSFHVGVEIGSYLDYYVILLFPEK